MTQASVSLPEWDSERRLPAGRLVPLLFRSFFLQGSWSFERMQSVGWTAALSGEGRRLAGGERAAGFLRRHLDYFNTNPVMASYLIGGVVRLEEDLKSGVATEEEVARFKRGLTSPLAAWGDTFFWASLRPAATAWGAAATLLWGAWGVLVYLIVYNAFHLYYRVRGLSEGYRWGPHLTASMARSAVKTKSGWVRRAGLFAAGALVMLSLERSEAFRSPWLLAVPILCGTLFFLFRRRIGTGASWGYLAAAAGLVYVWVVSGR